MTEPVRDRWAKWLLERRFGGDPERKKSFLEGLIPWRDRMLKNADIKGGETLLDVGAGDGLIALGDLDLVGEDVRVVFSDISQDLLDHSRAVAEEMGVADRCELVRASADDLSTLEDASVDAVTTRSVPIYAEDKKRAFEEFHRVLRLGRRLSIFKPINRFKKPEPPHRYLGYDVTPVRDIAEKVRAVYEGIQPLDSDLMLDFDERNPFDLAESAGFGEVHLNYEAEVTKGSLAVEGTFGWETLLRPSGNPKIPMLGEAMDEALTPEETERFTAHPRPLVENSRRKGTSVVAYLWAVKSGEEI